ncbi:MAG: hypothetical protein PHP64_07010 [Actinomycetota bacterium]|nr:hypothetical protein [Actinomycetota bacterium]
MICPHCGKNTSDMVRECEWCGSPIEKEDNTSSENPYESNFLGDEIGIPPSDAAYPGRETRLPEKGEPRQADPFYTKPWPYAIAIAIVLLVFGGFFLLKGKEESKPGLLVDNLPTVLYFYTDS